MVKTKIAQSSRATAVCVCVSVSESLAAEGDSRLGVQFTLKCCRRPFSLATWHGYDIYWIPFTLYSGMAKCLALSKKSQIKGEKKETE